MSKLPTWVLSGNVARKGEQREVQTTYIADKPEEAGVKCLRMDERRSVILIE